MKISKLVVPLNLNESTKRRIAFNIKSQSTLSHFHEPSADNSKGFLM